MPPRRPVRSLYSPRCGLPGTCTEEPTSAACLPTRSKMSTSSAGSPCSSESPISCSSSPKASSCRSSRAVPDLVLVGGLYAAGGVYVAALGRVRTTPWPRVVAFFTGYLALLVATAPPFDAAADRDLAWHMTQHLVLIGVAAPFLVVARPFRALGAAWKLPGPMRIGGRRLRRQVRRRGAAVLAGAGAIQAGTMAGGHVPGIYDAAMRNPRIHVAEHGALLLGACMLWWAVVESVRPRPALALLALFVDSLVCTALGIAMMLARASWYPAYGRGARALADQQVAGALMWGLGGLALLVGGAAIG